MEEIYTQEDENNYGGESPEDSEQHEEPLPSEMAHESLPSQIPPEIHEIDKELEELLKKQSAKIKVIGVGGGGNNSLSRMKEIGIKGGELIAVNTDAQDLLYANADQKILIGRE